jgi:hypothetical protein
MVKDALDAHAREELGLTGTNSARPLQAALFSALSFSAGAVLPLLVAWLAPATRVSVFIILSTLCSLAALGYISSVVSKASPVRAIIRITFWSTMAMVLSMGLGISPDARCFKTRLILRREPDNKRKKAPEGAKGFCYKEMKGAIFRQPLILLFGQFSCHMNAVIKLSAGNFV